MDTFEEPVGALWQKENERGDAVGALPDPLASLLPVKYAHLPAIVCIAVNGSYFQPFRELLLRNWNHLT